MRIGVGVAQERRRPRRPARGRRAARGGRDPAERHVSLLEDVEPAGAVGAQRDASRPAGNRRTRRARAIARSRRAASDRPRPRARRARARPPAAAVPAMPPGSIRARYCDEPRPHPGRDQDDALRPLPAREVRADEAVGGDQGVVAPDAAAGRAEQVHSRDSHGVDGSGVRRPIRCDQPGGRGSVSSLRDRRRRPRAGPVRRGGGSRRPGSAGRAWPSVPPRPSRRRRARRR